MSGKTLLFEIFSYYNQVNHSTSNMAATHEKFFLCLFLKSKVNQSTTESAYTFLGQVIQAILSLVFLDKIQSQPVNQEKRTHHILRQWISQWVERHHCLKFFPIITKSTIHPKKWRTHSLIFWLEITSQPFNQQYGSHTWEILPLSFCKIQSQPVNQEKRTYHILRHAKLIC